MKNILKAGDKENKNIFQKYISYEREDKTMVNIQTSGSYITKTSFEGAYGKRTAKRDSQAEGKYASVSEYETYLKNKYSCLTATDYKVKISPVFLEKCINDPQKAELLEKNLAHIPASKRMATAFWSAQGARVVNDELFFDENGNCCGSPNTYVTNSRSSSGSSDQDEIPEKKGRRKKPLLQKHYEKRKLLREQFDERLAEKEYLKEQSEEKEKKEELKKSILTKEQNAGRFIERYEANILTS